VRIGKNGRRCREGATELVAELEVKCGRRDFIDVFSKALTARRALVELGIGT